MRPHPSLSLDIYFFVRLSGPVLLLPYYYYDSHQLLDAVFFFSASHLSPYSLRFLLLPMAIVLSVHRK